MNKLTTIFFASLIIGLASCGHDQTADEAPAFQLSSDEIVNDFLDDEAGANAKYNDQVVQISGPVMELSKENGQVLGVKLSSDEFNIVNCTFQHPIDAGAITRNEITVKGKTVCWKCPILKTADYDH